MEIKITNRQLLRVLYILSWIIFIGIGIDAGGIISNTVYWLIDKPESAHYVWVKADLLDLYNSDPGYFVVICTIMSIVAVLKFVMFYLVVRMLHDGAQQFSRPFNKEVERFLTNIAAIAFAIGIFCSMAGKMSIWLVGNQIEMPTLESMELGGADVWMFMGVTLFIIVQLFKRGVEMQAENDLTI